MLVNHFKYEGLARESAPELAKKYFGSVCKAPKLIFDKLDILENYDVFNLVLTKYVYYRAILDNRREANKLMLATTKRLIEHYRENEVSHKALCEEIVDNDYNITISDENLTKCFIVLSDFGLLSDYSQALGLRYVGNGIQNFDKFITKSFIQNVDRIHILNITQECEQCARLSPILLIGQVFLDKQTFIAADDKDVERKNYLFDNEFDDFNLVIDWLFKNCKHIETFEIGVYAAVSQALYVREGFRAFKKFVKYAESLSDKNRVKLVNCLIDYYNSLGNVYQKQNTLQFIPQIIESLNLCDTIQDYPKSTIQLVVNGKINNMARRFINITEDLNDFAKLEFFAKALKDFRYNPENFVDSSKFSYNRTIPMRTLIDIF